MAVGRHGRIQLRLCLTIFSFGVGPSIDDPDAEGWRLDELGQGGHGLSRDRGGNEVSVECRSDLALEHLHSLDGALYLGQLSVDDCCLSAWLVSVEP